MSCMFYHCENLLNLDLSSFITNNVTNMSEMFYHCNNLKYKNISKIYIKKFNMLIKTNYLSNDSDEENDDSVEEFDDFDEESF